MITWPYDRFVVALEPLVESVISGLSELVTFEGVFYLTSVSVFESGTTSFSELELVSPFDPELSSF